MKIIADSSCDLYTLDVPEFTTVPLTIYTDERSFIDDDNLNITEMLDYLAAHKGRSYTSCPTVDAWLAAFEGSTEIFATTVTSALSGSYNSAMTAASIYKEAHPEAKISIIDSLSTGGEEVLLLYKLAELMRTNDSFEAIDKQIRTYLSNTRLFFSFFSLHNLSQNGRVSKVATISVTGKARGERKAIHVLIKDMKKAGYTGKRAIITHVENEPMALSLKQELCKEYPEADIHILPTRGLCSYYMERKGIVISCETAS